MARSNLPKLPAPRPELAALLDAAREEGEDDTSRLVLADWLAEQRRPEDRIRGEFVRAQVMAHRAEMDDPRTRAAHDFLRVSPYHSHPFLEEARKRLFADRPEVQSLAAQADALVQKYGQRWAGLLGVSSRHATWKRGLLEVGCSVRAFPSREMDVVAASELGCWVGRIGLRDISAKDCARIGRCALLGRATALSLYKEDRHQGGLESLLASTHLRQLTHIRLETLRKINEAEVAAFASLSALRSIEIQGNGAVGGVEKLSSSARWSQLHTLQLRSAHLNAELLAALFAGGQSLSLQELDLTYNDLGEKGPTAFPDHLDGLRLLSLGYNALGVDGVRALLDWPGLPNVTALNLSGNALGDSGAELLADHPGLSNLTSLNLAGNQIGPRGVEALAHSPHLRGLLALDLSGNVIGPEGADILARRHNFPDLLWLGFWDNSLTPEMAGSVQIRFL